MAYTRRPEGLLSARPVAVVINTAVNTWGNYATVLPVRTTHTSGHRTRGAKYTGTAVVPVNFLRHN